MGTLELNSSSQIAWAGRLEGVPAEPREVHFGNGGTIAAFQVAVAESEQTPSRGHLKKLFESRRGNLNIFLVVAVVHDKEVTLLGPNPEAPEITLKKSVAIRFLNAVLAQPTQLLAYHRAMSLFRSNLTTDVAGFTNQGLFATYLVRDRVPDRNDWPKLVSDSRSLANLRHKELIAGLGFDVEAGSKNTLTLKTKGDPDRVVAILLEGEETFEGRSDRFQASPVEWGLMVATERKVPWLVALREDQIRLYPAKDGVGVGQKSQAETYFEVDLVAIDEEQLGYLKLIFSADALAEGGTTQQLLSESKKFASDLGTRLRERIYLSVVPGLSVAVAERLRDLGNQLDDEGLALAYKLTLRILFRLLFQAYAEDRGLLPAGRNERYDKNSLKSWADSFTTRNPSDPWGDSSGIWYDLIQVWNAIDEGNPEMQVPAYNGGLFGSNSDLHPAGALIKQLELKDKHLGPALAALLIDQTEDGVLGPVDFRSLSVREFGTIYEGLLESNLSLADVDLKVDTQGAWVPASENEVALVTKGGVYFHSASGEREATGSYYTPSFIVDLLVSRSIEPALNKHLLKVKSLIRAGDDSAAYAEFFNFKIADLAMGSAHFLVAAIDKVEAMMRSFLADPDNLIPRLTEEMKRLEQAANEALGLDVSSYEEIERSSLLRRQIARRCIYGLDINELAVELSRLAIWIHTFVPGLPMSSLDHNLVCGNSLTGIGTIDEALDIFMPERAGGPTLVDEFILRNLESSRERLESVIATDEATKRQVKEAEIDYKKAKLEALESRKWFDIAMAARLGLADPLQVTTSEQIDAQSKNDVVKALVEQLEPAHLPYLFPEVFLRENPGFDVLIGNPPFKEATVEELSFWTSKFPGLKAKSSRDQTVAIHSLRDAYPKLVDQLGVEQRQFELLRKSLIQGPFPGMGTGDPDLYKAFAWRYLDLCRRGGSSAIVLPISAWNTLGSAPWRRKLFSAGSLRVVFAKNSGEWAFENVNVGYRFSFLAFESGQEPEIQIQGEFKDFESFMEGVNKSPTRLYPEDILRADPEAALPTFDSTSEFLLWSKLIKHPPIGDGRLVDARTDFQVAPMTEIHASNDGRDRLFTNSDSDYPVFKHLSVGDLEWNYEEAPFNFVDYKKYLVEALESAQSLFKRRKSAYSLLSAEELSGGIHPILKPRIVFRDVVHSSNKRKVWFCLAPAKTLLTNAAPYLIFRGAPVEVQSFFLGVVCSAVLDWFGTSRIGLHLNFFIFYTLPVPTYIPTNPLHKRLGQLAAGLATVGKGDFGEWRDFAPTITGQEARREAKAELDAIVSVIFDLTEEELELVFDPSNETRSPIELVQKHYRRIKDEM